MVVIKKDFSVFFTFFSEKNILFFAPPPDRGHVPPKKSGLFSRWYIKISQLWVVYCFQTWPLIKVYNLLKFNLYDDWCRCVCCVSWSKMFVFKVWTRVLWVVYHGPHQEEQEEGALPPLQCCRRHQTVRSPRYRKWHNFR